MSDIRVCLILHGKIGNVRGKHSESETSSKEVLEIAYKHNLEHIIQPYNADVFLHSWSTELKDGIVELYHPKKYKIESQIQFEIPPYIKADKNRAFAHLSRWYSFKEAVLQMDHYMYDMFEIPQFKPYTHVIIQRFDLCWNVTPKFEEMDSDYFWVGKSTLNTNVEWSDRWFCSNPVNMLSFSTLYDCIPKYMQPGGSLPSEKQYKGISSHYLSKHHAEQRGLEPRWRYEFGGYNNPVNDYSEIRRQFFGDDR